MAHEIGYARDEKRGRTSRTAEDNWELRWPLSLTAYSKMAREDSQVKSVIKAVTQPIARTPWRIEPNGADPGVVAAIAQDLDLPVMGEDTADPIRRHPRRVRFKAHLRRALKWQLIYGHGYFEMVWEDATETEDGLTHLRKVAPRHPDTITKITVAKDGGLESITQRGIDTSGAIKIPVDHLLVYVSEDDNDDWIGESMLRAAYKHWRLKDQFLRLEATVLDRNGMGVPIATAGPVTDDEGKDALQDTVEGIRSGDYAGATLGDGEKLEIMGVKGQLVSPREAISYHDSQIARTALAHALNLDGKGGSYALAEVQMDLFFQSLNEIAQNFADTANQHLVREMVRHLTGDEQGPYPLIVFDTIEAKKTLTPTDLATLKNAGLIFAGPVTEAHLRRTYEMPAEPLPPRPKNEDGDEDGGGSGSDKKLDADEMNKLVTAATGLIRAGFTPESSLEAVGLPAVEHTGLQPVTVKDKNEAAATAPAPAIDDPDDLSGEEES